MKVIITFTFCCDNLRKSKFMALEKPGKLREFVSPTLWPPWCIITVYHCVTVRGCTSVIDDISTHRHKNRPRYGNVYCSGGNRFQ